MKSKRKLFVLAICSLVLVSCNSGTNSTKLQEVQSYKEFATLSESFFSQETQQVDLNLYNSIFISPNQEYQYQIVSNDGKLASGNVTGLLKCSDAKSCLISGVIVNKNIMYSIMISDKDNVFIGGDVFYVKNATMYQDIVIDDVSTSNYISQKIQSQLDSPFNISNVEDQLFKKARSYKPNVQNSELIYAYYNFLKNKEVSNPLDTMTEQYKMCEVSNICELDPEFIRNEHSVIISLAAADKVIDKYAKDKKDTTLYSSYKWFKDNIKDKFLGVKDIISGGVNIFFAGAGDKIVSGASELFTTIDKGFNIIGLDNSKEAYTRIELFNNNLAKYYSAATPNYSEISLQIGAELLSLQIRRDFLLKNNYTTSTKMIVNNNLGDLDIVSYVNNNSNKLSFEWLSKVWSLENVSSRKENIEYISDRQNIIALAKSYQQIIQTDRRTGVNNILKRNQYNQLLIANMQDSINALQSAMYLDYLSLLLRDKKNDFKGLIESTQITIATIALTGNYEVDLSRLRNYYSIKLNNLKVAYQSVILAEKSWVADNVLQSVQVDGKCNITDTDGLNYITAVCPYRYQASGVLKTKYITSTLNKSDSKCFTTNKDSSGDIMYIADVQNIGGVLQCLNTFPLNDNSTENSTYLVETSSLTTSVDNGNSWYWNDNNYFNPSFKQDGASMLYSFLSNPDGNFKFQSTGHKKTISNVLDLFDTKLTRFEKSGLFSNVRNYLTFTTFIRDNNDNLIGGFSFNDTTLKYVFRSSTRGLSMKSLYANAEYEKNVWTIDEGFIEADSVLNKKYRIEVVGVSIPNPNTYDNSSYNVNWMFTGANPDGSNQIIQPSGTWMKSCNVMPGSSISNGYWLIANCTNSNGEHSVNIAGSKINHLQNCWIENNSLKCEL